MKFKVEMQHIIQFVVEAENEERFMDWSACVTPTEAREIIESKGDSLETENYYDEVIEFLNEEAKAVLNLKELNYNERTL